MVGTIMQYKYCVVYMKQNSSWGLKSVTHDQRFKVDFFTDRELELFCNSNNAVSVTYLNQCREKPIEK